ncbi:hypothetical protein [Jiangella alkaliphila]|uniref:Uncharacterized protein n=1 Tax=Jiangella alkaliphila TaxID=419479 RepID=A0A1H2L7T8_9ACTN|nr:hypothetical protein [Jiangella alkaliphila]SDU76651.1 hypothetical protein SAMN04488563_5271 [Jiangella alkaliphila]
MPERHVMAPLRRWLIQPGSPPKVIAILLLILMASMVALLTVRNEAPPTMAAQRSWKFRLVR